jgi:hypothetical protein
MITFRLSAPTPSLNPSSGASGNWRARHARKRKLQREWATEIVFNHSPIAVALPIVKSRVTIERHSAGVLDVDNLYGGVKPLLDVLKPMDPKRNPFGLGIILDDKPDNLELIVRQVKSTRAAACTVVTIEPITQT